MTRRDASITPNTSFPTQLLSCRLHRRNMSTTKEFRSLYRLTLRALSASVLHQPAATRNLRSTFQGVFRDHAAKLSTLSQEEETIWNDRSSYLAQYTYDQTANLFVRKKWTALSHYYTAQRRHEVSHIDLPATSLFWLLPTHTIANTRRRQNGIHRNPHNRTSLLKSNRRRRI